MLSTIPNPETTNAYFLLNDPISAGDSKPPFKVYLYINPSRTEFSYKQKSTTTRTRAGFVQELWGEEIDTARAEGCTGGFVIMDGTDPGYSATDLSYISSSSKSEAYTAFQNLIAVFRNNGVVSNTGNVTVPTDQSLGASTGIWGETLLWTPIVFIYDGFNYYGSFDEFTVEATDDKKFSLNFSFTFKILFTEDGVGNANDQR